MRARDLALTATLILILAGYKRTTATLTQTFPEMKGPLRLEEVSEFRGWRVDPLICRNLNRILADSGGSPEEPLWQRPKRPSRSSGSTFGEGCRLDDGSQTSGLDLVLAQNRPQSAPPKEKIWNDFDGNKTLAEAVELASLGPRPAGSEANAKVRAHLAERLKQFGWAITEQGFREHSPDGKLIEFCNVIARFPGPPFPSKRLLIGAHFDTIPTKEFRAIGATDGAANSAILLEIARVLSSEPALAGQVDLLFFDGDAPFKELNLSDGLFGSRFYVQMLRIQGHPEDVRAAILLRNTGSGVLNYAPNGDQALIDRLKDASVRMGFNLEPANRLLLADQMPFLQAGIPSVALLEANSNILHTADDTTERLNADSLAKTGKILLYFVATMAKTQ